VLLGKVGFKVLDPLLESILARDLLHWISDIALQVAGSYPGTAVGLAVEYILHETIIT